MHAVVVHRGKHYIVKALENENGKCYFLEFYDDELEQSEKKKVLK